MPDTPPVTPATPRSIWIARPWIDLVIGCGGWSLPLLAVSYLVSGDAARQWSGAFYSLALVTNYPHYMATIYRAYGRRDRSANHAYIVWGTVLLIVLAVLAHVDLSLLPWLFTAYIMWSPWHYTGQNYGLMMMFLRRGGLEIGARQRRLLRIAFVASYVMLLAAFNEAGSTDPLVIGLGLPVNITRLVGIAGAVAFLGCGAAGFVMLSRRAARASMTAPLVLYVTQGLWFVVPTVVTWVTSLAVPQTRYSSGVLALMHSAQYLWITQYFAKREQGAAFVALRYWAAVIVGGIALFLPVPWIASYVAHADFTASMFIVTAVVNLHHFMLDGVVWKLRDPRVSRALTTSEDAAAPAVPPAAAFAWPNVALAIAAVALLTLAGVDQWRYRLASQTADPAALESALQLNPYDRSAEVRLARAHLDRGDQLDAAGHSSDALPHYQAFLESVLANKDQGPNPEVVIPVIIRFGDALAKAGHDADAQAQYRLAIRLAEQAGRRDLAGGVERKLK